MIIWIGLSVLAAGGLGILLYRKIKNPKGIDGDSKGNTESVKKFTDKDKTSIVGMRMSTRFSDTNVRESPKVDNGTLGFGSNLIGTVPNAKTHIGIVESTTTGSDGYTWLYLELTGLKEFDSVNKGWVRSDVIFSPQAG